MSVESNNIINVTSEAATKANELMEDRGLDGYGIRISVDYKGGDADYSLEFSQKPMDSDRIVETDGLTLFIDSESEAAVEGSTLDYVVENGRGGFTVKSAGGKEEAEFDESTPEGQVRSFLVRNFPQIQGHGGEAIIEELDEEEGYVKLSLEGACSGCGISDATAEAIMRKLPKTVEGISRVEVDAGSGGAGADVPF
ncbi:NifU family protein [Halorutilales archaeon Cl-col2-1]